MKDGYERKISFLMENRTSLSEQDQDMITRLYLKVRAKAEANETYIKVKEHTKEQTEIGELLSSLVLSNSELISKRSDLYNLKDLLSTYFHSKGMNHTQFRIDDLLSMIQSDIIHMNNHIFDNKESMKFIKR